MAIKSRKLISVSLVLGVLLFAAAPMVAVSAFAQDDNSQSEKSKKKSKSYGASSAPVVETHTSSKVTLHEGKTEKKTRVWNVQSKTAHQAALKQVTASLLKVEKRLAKADSTSERAALETARDGLLAALEGLKHQAHLAGEVVELKTGTDITVIDALKHIEHQQHDLDTMRADVIDELNGVREELADALGDVELEIGLDGEVRALRIESLKNATTTLNELEAEQLKALKLAEEKLKRARIELEKKLAKEKGKQ